FSEEGKLLTWNKAVESITGFSRNELKNKFVSEFIITKDKEVVVKKFMELLAEGDDKEPFIEYSIKQKLGEIIPVVAMRSLILIDGEKYIVGMLIDIRKLKDNKDKLKARITHVNKFKNQLKEYYSKIENMNQAEIQLKEKLFINAKDFSNKLINSLPGIFYLYQKVGDKFFLKRWNDNLESSLGYSKEELYNMQPYQFFTKNEYTKVEKAIMQVFSTGLTQIHSHIIKKNSEEIPYFYEAYKFESNDNVYFMGLGLDLTLQYKLEKEKKQEKYEKQKVQKVLESREKELVTTALQISRNSSIIESTLKRLDVIVEQNHTSKIIEELVSIKNDLHLQNKKQDNWEIFKLQFVKVHKDFFDNLNKKHPTLSKSELKFLAYLSIHLSSSQISSIQNVTSEAIKKTRYRIRKKLNLLTKDSLEKYISNF
ncbi:MAG: PAS domain S-box protein, partial [Psychrilyobacter sp.]|nr:PAS domain S-box protein [Psychrilyobacter sp.]